MPLCLEAGQWIFVSCLDTMKGKSGILVGEVSAGNEDLFQDERLLLVWGQREMSYDRKRR